MRLSAFLVDSAVLRYPQPPTRQSRLDLPGSCDLVESTIKMDSSWSASESCNVLATTSAKVSPLPAPGPLPSRFISGYDSTAPACLRLADTTTGVNHLDHPVPRAWHGTVSGLQVPLLPLNRKGGNAVVLVSSLNYCERPGCDDAKSAYCSQ
jgi:hypothetical protein